MLACLQTYHWKMPKLEQTTSGWARRCKSSQQLLLLLGINAMVTLVDLWLAQSSLFPMQFLLAAFRNWLYSVSAVFVLQEGSCLYLPHSYSVAFPMYLLKIRIIPGARLC